MRARGLMPLGLGDLERLADHQAAGEEEQEADQMQGEPAHRDREQALPVEAQQEQPERDDAGRDRRALEMAYLAGLGREGLRGDVVPGEPAQPAADEVHEDDLVERTPQARRERDAGRGHPERDDVGERIELAPHRRGVMPPPGDAPVEHVEDQGHEDEGGHAAESVGDREEVRQVKVADHREVAAGHDPAGGLVGSTPTMRTKFATSPGLWKVPTRSVSTLTANWRERAFAYGRVVQIAS